MPVPDLSWYSYKYAFQVSENMEHYSNFTYSYPDTHRCASFKNMPKHTTNILAQATLSKL